MELEQMSSAELISLVRRQEQELVAQRAASVHDVGMQDAIGIRLRRVAKAAGVEVEGDNAFYYGCAFSILGNIAGALERAASVPAQAGWVMAPHYRGYAALGTGQYVINHSAAGAKPEFVISIATEAEKYGRIVGDERDNADDAVLMPDAMAVRIAFTNVSGLDAMEKQLRQLRAVHFPVPQPDIGRDAALVKLVRYGFDGTLGGDFGECDKGPYWMVKDVERALATQAAPEVVSVQPVSDCEKCSGHGCTHYPDGEWEGKCAACEGTGVKPDIGRDAALVDLREFKDGQWWVKELDDAVQNGTFDQKRAVAVVRHMLQIAALVTQAAPEVVSVQPVIAALGNLLGAASNEQRFKASAEARKALADYRSGVQPVAVPSNVKRYYFDPYGMRERPDGDWVQYSSVAAPSAPEVASVPDAGDEPVASVNISNFRGLENVDFQMNRDLPDGTHQLYTRPQPAPAVLDILDPRKWDEATSKAWHEAIPDMHKAFAALRAVLAAAAK